MAVNKVLMVASEAEPFAKTGGLGDVVGSLPKAFAALGIDSRVIMPLYGMIPEKYKSQMEYLGYIYVDLGWRHQYCGIFKLWMDGVTFYFLDNEFYYNRGKLYDDMDLEKFSFLCRASFEVAKYVGFSPDIIHIHDWHTGAMAALLNDYYRYQDEFKNTKCVYTIHNLQYQGQFDKFQVLDMLPLDWSKYLNTSTISFMALGIQYSHRVTTVSDTYAYEILSDEYGEGLQGLLRNEQDKLYGILNGIDQDTYNSETDRFIPRHFGLLDLEDGKTENKRALLEELGFDADSSMDVPLIGVVSRLASQKGMNLLLDVADDLLNQDVRIVLLGSGDKKLENDFANIQNAHYDKFRACLKFDNALAHRIYASSDMFLMPSAFEPCGLAQMICLRYGTVPIVRACGGLKDSIMPFNEYTSEGNGFTFDNFNAYDFYNTIEYAISMYYQKDKWYKIIYNGSQCDFSWTNSAKKYLDLYNNI